MPQNTLPTPPIGAFPHGGIVPYIASWSSEVELPATPVERRGRLGYADEDLNDRDRLDVLWRRVGHSPGQGRPTFGIVHSLRQRRAMRRVLCQVCGDVVGDDDHGVLWLMGREEYQRAPWPAPIDTPHPPVCLPCAEVSITACPHLRNHYVAVRVRRYRVAGAYGAIHQPRLTGPIAVDVGSVAFDDHRILWMQASQLIMRLTDYRVVDLDAEIAAHKASR